MKFQLDLSNVGGMPFELDDLDYLVLGVNETFKDLFSTWGTSFVLAGCEVSVVGTDYVISPGIIVLEGEVLPFSGAPVPISINIDYFILNIAFDPAGNEVFQDTNSFDTYAIRTAIVQSAASQPANTMLVSPRRTIHDLISEKTGDFTKAFVADSSNWFTAPLTAGTVSIVVGQEPEVIVLDNGKVQFRGLIQTAVNPFLVNPGGIPIKFRPAFTKYFEVTNQDSPGTPLNLEIRPDGSIFLNGASSTYVWFDGVSYYALS